MGDAERVRASRDGDRFHYYWAARRALRLLDMTSDLKVVGVEGLPEGEEVTGEEVIDVAEYHGGRDASTCRTFRYVQLKHSTMRTEDPIVASELKNTLEKFATIYRTEMEKGRETKLEFVFVANRRLNDKVRLSLEELAAGAKTLSNKPEAELLRRYMGFGADTQHEADFCRRLKVEDGSPGIADMEQLLRGELQQFLPGGGTGTEMSQLMETVSRCATSLVDKQTLEAGDILVALRTTEEELFPARSAIEQLDHIIHTKNVDDVSAELRNGPNNKILITAVGGVGKSILTSILPRVLPKGSVTIVYDCFAGGDYRKITSQRHEHRTALTQISNELAASGWCTPLIPTEATEALYTQVFMRRIRSAADQLAHNNPDALLTVVIDAADNAAMAAEEQQQRTFVTHLFWEDWPPNARLVQLCRPERKHLLKVPNAGVTEITLGGFQKAESLEHLRTRFPDATEPEGAELHVLSDGNPRVQAMAMENAESVTEALAAIQIARTVPGEVLDSLLAKQVRDVADQGHLLPNELSRLCKALATLHPPMPLDDLAAITNLDADAIRSFAVALGRGLHAAGNILQFRDEPTETWFRTTHGVELAQKREFAMSIKQFAARSPYVASTLPQLFFEAEMLDELVELALSDSGLPGEIEELQAQEIARSRARFALCAMLRAERNADAALLAVKAGDMSSGHSRKMTLFRTHTDLAARFLDANVIEALCSGRELATDWPGSNLHVEAALLSHIDRFKDLARSRLRSAINNFIAILKLPNNEQSRLDKGITADAVADLAMVATNVDGPKGGLVFISRWRPENFVHEVAVKLCARLADAGRYDDLAGLIVTGKQHEQVQVAAAETLFRYNVVPSDEAIEALVEMLGRRKEPFRPVRDALPHEHTNVRAVVWGLVYGLRARRLSDAETLRILDIHLPDHLPDSAGSRLTTLSLSSLLLAYALRARLTGDIVKVEDVASEKLLKLMEQKEQSSDHNVRDFKANIPGILPWAECWLAAIMEGDTEEIASRLHTLTSNYLKPVSSYNPPFVYLNAVAEIAARILTLIPRGNLIEKFASWHKANDEPLTRSRLAVARIASRSPHLQTLGLETVTRGIEAAQCDRTDAETRVETLVDLARTLLVVNETEARATFEAAMAEAEQVGDDLYARWQSLVDTAKTLATGVEPVRAYRLFQIGESLDRAQVDFHTIEFAERLRGMHEPTYFAATSRARDRRTFPVGLMLTPAFKGAAGPGPERLALLALYAFEPQMGWETPVAGLSPDSAATATSVFEAFTRYERPPGEVLEEPYRSPSIFGERESDPPSDPAVQFADSDFTTEDAWNKAFSELRWRAEERRALAEFALNKHPNRRPEVLDALGRATRATKIDFANLAQAAAQQPQTLALKKARERLATTLATRFARHICTRAYEDPDTVTVAEATGTTVSELTQISFRELGRSAHRLTYREYFFLASHLANALDTEAAGGVFDALANLFEDLAPSDTSSDGPYESLPSPSADFASYIAGLLWAALGDISSESRWRAAHAVLLLVRLGCKGELDALAQFADGTEPLTPFVDARFPFYSLHARMWLLLALARAAKEPNAVTMTGFTSWLADVVRGPHHAANQVLAQRTLVDLSERDLIALAPADADVLTTRVVADWVEMEYNERRARPNPLDHGDETGGIEPERDRFFFDFEQYWCRDVAEIFGSTERDIARRAAETVTKFDGYDVFATTKDPRSSAGVYDQRRSYPDHRSWPGEDIHSFYMGIHGLLTVSAKLAETESAYKEPDSIEDSYTGWLAQFLPKRPDGRWLADRRDPPPTPAPDRALALQESKADWPWTLSKSDFERVAGAGGDWVTVQANIDSTHGKLSEDTLVGSALVPNETARSLLIALQTSPLGPCSFRMPTTDDPYDRPDKHPFELIPWLDMKENHYGVDERDERGGGIRFPPTRPGENIISRFNLTTDEDQRVWFHNGLPVFRSRVWSNMRPGLHDREDGTRGEQLEVHHEFLKTVLQELGMTLALQVGLRRDRHRPYYERRKGGDDEFDWLERSGKVYLIGPRGDWLEY
ncbi:hypothetical protein [Microbispora sp. H10949]|uniref:hypothetical protein n=1 Tax=Microbispora sp. H10949 TaxID=2729111 RepID=UPI0016035180|nr:hypothetical protein [Microbispora sp. H10949]